MCSVTHVQHYRTWCCIMHTRGMMAHAMHEAVGTGRTTVSDDRVLMTQPLLPLTAGHLSMIHRVMKRTKPISHALHRRVASGRSTAPWRVPHICEQLPRGWVPIV